MKICCLILIISISANTVFSQVAIKISSNLSKFRESGRVYSDFKPGLGAAIRINKPSKVPAMRFVFDQGIELLRTNISYRVGGLGAGAYISGNLQFVKLETSPRIRLGKQFFFIDLGIFASIALSKRFLDGTVSAWAPPPASLNQNIDSYISDFNSFNLGSVTGIGFRIKRCTIETDIRVPLPMAGSYQFPFVQYALNFTFPFKISKKEL